MPRRLTIALRWDCISIQQKPVSKSLFRQAEDRVLLRNKQQSINATEFELLTATAFEIFAQENVQVGVVEAGMGGRLDATNVLKSKAVTVIAKIGLDHQEFLGDTLMEITKEKCGIFRDGVPVCFDPTNEVEVIETIKHEASVARASLEPPLVNLEGILLEHFQYQEHQRTNALLALSAAQVIFRCLNLTPSYPVLDAAIRSTNIPGRLQKVNLEPVTGINTLALIDGAHNLQAIDSIRPYIAKLRHSPGAVLDRGVTDEKQSITARRSSTAEKQQQPSARHRICWVIAASEGKDVLAMLRPLLHADDTMATVEFGPVDGMPWKHPMPSKLIGDLWKEDQHPLLETTESLKVVPERYSIRDFGPDIKGALTWVSRLAAEHGQQVVILGSLYLVSDVLRMLRDVEADR